MKKLNFSFSSIVSKLCVALMAFLGFGCDDKNGDGGLLMYGCPTGSWEIKGEVTDEADEAVPDATVRVTFPDANSSEYTLSESQTDEAGFYISTGHSVTEKLKVVCIPDDPALEPDSTIVKMQFSGGKKDNMWDLGSASATADFKLKKKED